MADGEKNALMRVGGAVQPIVPQSFEEAWRVAGALAASGLAPKDLSTQEKVLAVIMAGAEIGMAPFQALQSFAVINGRPALWGDGMLATVRKFGVTVEEWLEGNAEEATAACKVVRPDTKEVIERRFSVADAKRAGLWGKQGPWSSYPKRMLQMRARAWALRDGCADMLRGMKMAEEAQDVEVVDDQPLDERPLLAGRGYGAMKDSLVEDWNARMRACTTTEDVDDILAEALNYPDGRFSDNVIAGLREVAANERDRINEGMAPREAQPSPFEALKEEGLAVMQTLDPANRKVALAAWQAKARSKTKLALCSPDERAELKTLEKNIKAEVEAA